MKDTLKENNRKAGKQAWINLSHAQRSKIMKERAKVRTRNKLKASGEAYNKLGRTKKG